MDYFSTIDHLEKTFGPQDVYPEYQRALRELYIKLEILKQDPAFNPIGKFVIDTIDREFSHILPSGNAIHRLGELGDAVVFCFGKKLDRISFTELDTYINSRMRIIVNRLKETHREIMEILVPPMGRENPYFARNNEKRGQ